MQDEYIMKMVSRSFDDGDKPLVIEITSVAEFTGNGDNYRIAFTEDEGERKGCKTTLTVLDGSCITIVRDGSYVSEMTIEKNIRHLSQIATPFGSFSIGASAQYIESRMTENGGSLLFRYQTDVELRPASDIEIELTIEKITD